ncbi:MAG: YraN family protein [Chitinophagaceae bacterium]
MASHNDLGRYGEALGKEFIESNGYNIMHLNWKHSYYEIDIIASKNSVLHFIEVKTRTSEAFGLPEESVDKKKMNKMMKAGEEFLYRFPKWDRVQYDILSISLLNRSPQFYFIEDIYF